MAYKSRVKDLANALGARKEPLYSAVASNLQFRSGSAGRTTTPFHLDFTAGSSNVLSDLYAEVAQWFLEGAKFDRFRTNRSIRAEELH